MATSELTRREFLALSALGLIAGPPGFAQSAEPQGQLTWGIHVSLAPTWFDPAETPGLITPYMILYALHDALVKPMPGQPLAPCLAESFATRWARHWPCSQLGGSAGSALAATGTIATTTAATATAHNLLVPMRHPLPKAPQVTSGSAALDPIGLYRQLPANLESAR